MKYRFIIPFKTEGAGGGHGTLVVECVLRICEVLDLMPGTENQLTTTIL